MPLTAWHTAITMKRFLTLIFAVAMLLSFSACAGSGNETTTQPDADNTTADSTNDLAETQSKALVVYFSCTGNTKNAAEKIARIAGADLHEIIPKEPYTDEDLDYTDDNCRANKEMNSKSARPKIENKIENLDSYDVVYIGYPIWWSTMPKIINTLLDTYDLSGKTVMPFCTSGSSPIDTSVDAIKAEEPDADVKSGLRLNGGETDEIIMAWLKDNSQSYVTGE